MSRANADLMDMLHGLVADGLKQELIRAKNAKDEDGNPIPINPQLLDKAMKFLKDNGIDAPKSSPKVDSLANQLAALDIDLDEAAVENRLN
jgi:hypothetical protein